MLMNSMHYSIMNEVLYKNIMAIELVCVSSSMCCLCWLCLHIVGCRLNIFSLLFQRKIHLSSSLLWLYIFGIENQNKSQNTSKQKHKLTYVKKRIRIPHILCVRIGDKYLSENNVDPIEVKKEINTSFHRL